MKKRSVKENLVYILLFIAIFVKATDNFFGFTNNIEIITPGSDEHITLTGVEKKTIPTEDEILEGKTNKEIFNYYVTKQRYIMHAGGSIDNKKYTNSYDALKYNYDNGNRIYEIDLNFTSDQEVVLVHGWSEYDYQYRLGLKYDKNHPIMDSNTFKNSLIQGKYDSMTIDDLIKFMRNNPYCYFILNIKEGYNVNISKKMIKRIINSSGNDAKILNRFVIWGYNPSVIKEVKKLYNFELLSMYYKNVKLMDKQINSNEKFINYCVNNGISSIIINSTSYNEEMIRMAKEKGIYVFLYTIDNDVLAQGYFQKGITMIMSNVLTN